MKPSKNYALITGATSGIGYELAKLFINDDYNLILASRDEAALRRTRNELNRPGLDIVTIPTDLFNPDSPFQLYDDVNRRGLRVDVLVNNAAQGLYGEFKETDLTREMSIIQLNISSMVSLTKLFLADMLQAGTGKILNLSSVAAKAPGPYQSVYHGTKAFVQSFTEALRNELKEENIVVTALLPGVTDTDFFRKADMLDSKAVEGEMANPADVAKDGYDALMRGDDMVISGFKNKVAVMMSNVMPDKMAAETMRKQQEPAKDKNE